MASMGIDGLISGLDTTSLINALMTNAAGPQALLKTKQTETTTLITAFQALNTKVASLADSAKTAAKPASWNALTSTSSASSVTAASGTGAQPGVVTFRTDALAKAQVSLVDDTALAGATTFTVKIGTKLTTITAASADPRDIAAALNKSDGGVGATTIRTNSTTPATYELQLTGKSTGTDNAFTLYVGTAADVTAGTATAVTLNTLTTPANAQITLFAGTTAEKVLTSQNNTFTGLTAGIDVTISKVETDPVTVTSARDEAALKKLASGLVGALTVALSEISSRSTTTTTTAADGSSVVTGGIFTGESAVRGMSDQLITAMSMPVGAGASSTDIGVSPATFGVVLGKDGTFTFDDAKFSAALAADPVKVQSWLTELATRVGAVATSVSDPIDGSLTRQITGQQTVNTDLGDQIADWDRRLALRKEGLQATYTALEVSLSALKAQGTWLTSQLAALNPTTSS